ncbi:transmembrane protein 43 [Arctopsyche grandis]|uniref:transmembrane protein 43 n=1 Tax=Arctopsyche grandis TaxID=121162 RepID=UPI00406D94B4
MANTVYNQFKATWLTTTFSSLLFCSVIYLLLWNEIQAIVISLAMEQGTNLVVSLNPNSPNLDADFEGQLVHLVGPIQIMEPLTEPDYNIQVLSVKLKKRVQMFQWIEEATEKDDFANSMDFDSNSKSYSYFTDWLDYLVDSNLFYMSPGHHNPKDMSISGQTYIAENVKIGNVFLGIEAKRKFSDYSDITSDERPDRHDIKLHSGAYYHGADPLVHEVGDLRILFSYAGRNNDDYSVIGVLDKLTIQPYITEISSQPLILLRKGRYSAEDMLALEFQEARRIAWRYRAVGWFQMFAAAMSLHPDWFALLLNCKWVSPRLRTHGRFFINLGMSSCATILIISTAWMVYAPIISMAMFLFLVFLPVFYFSSFNKYSTNTRNTQAGQEKSGAPRKNVPGLYNQLKENIL